MPPTEVPRGQVGQWSRQECQGNASCSPDASCRKAVAFPVGCAYWGLVWIQWGDSERDCEHPLATSEAAGVACQ